MRKRSLLVFLAALCACVPLPDPAPGRGRGSGAIDRAPFAPLAPGSYEQISLHFKVRAYGADNARRISSDAEGLYRTIMEDTNLYSFMPSGLYELVIYGSHTEFMTKTRLPEWSGGVSYGNAIYSFEGSGLRQTVAHEMSHLVFNEFMTRPRPDLLWVNEGLAVYEQSKAGPGGLFAEVRDRLRSEPLSMAEMLTFVPLSDGASAGSDLKVRRWYAQAQSMVRLLVEKGGRLGFSQFLQALKDGKGFDAAFSSAYPGEWRNLSEFYTAWRAEPP